MISNIGKLSANAGPVTPSHTSKIAMNLSIYILSEGKELVKFHNILDNFQRQFGDLPEDNISQLGAVFVQKGEAALLIILDRMMDNKAIIA